MNRENALKVLTEHTRSDSLIKHAVAVEAAMKAYAQKYGEEHEKWGIAGLLHDFDYEIYPQMDRHAFEGYRILKERGFPEEIAHAILAHSDFTGAKRETLMEKTLYAVDELAGFIIAVALVRPSKSLAEVDAPAVRRKMKDKAFARAVNRDEIVRGAQELGIDLDQHIAFVIQALQRIAPDLGLAGKID